MEKQGVWPPHWLSSKESDFNMGDTGEAGLIPELGRSPGGEHGNPLQYSCLENTMDRGAWWTIVHRVAKSWTRLKQLGISGEKRPKCHHQSVSSVAQSCWILCDPMVCLACQGPLSMGFSRQEYWSGLPFPSPGDLPNSGIKPVSLMSPALAGRFFTTSAAWKAI